MDDLNQALCLGPRNSGQPLHSSLALRLNFLQSGCSYGERKRLLQLAFKSQSVKLRRYAESSDNMLQLKTTFGAPAMVVLLGLDGGAATEEGEKSDILPVYVVGCDEAIRFARRGPLHFQDLGSRCLYHGGQQVFRCGIQSPDIHTTTCSTPS